MQGAQPESPPTAGQVPGQASDPQESLPTRPASPRLCFLRLEEGTGRSHGSQGRAQALAPFLPGRLAAALCLPQSAPSTKVARQVPGRRQSSRLGWAWLPGTELEGAPDTQNKRQKGETVQRSEAFPHPRSFWGHERPLNLARAYPAFSGGGTGETHAEPTCASQGE